MTIGKLQSNADRGLVTTGRARSAKKLNNGVWLSLVERLVRDQEVGCSNHLTPTKIGFEKRFSEPFSLPTAMQNLRADDYIRQPSLLLSRQIGIYKSFCL